MDRLGRRLTQKQARLLLADALELRIDPRRIARSVTRLERHLVKVVHRRIPLPAPAVKGGLNALGPRLPFVVGPRFFPNPKPLSANRSSLLMEDLVLNREQPELSLWWQDRLDQLATDGFTIVKGRTFRDLDAVRQHLYSYLLPMLEGLSRNGWDDSIAGSGPGFASIGANGELLKAESVNHRVFLSRALGVREFPVRVRTVHRDWWEANVLKGRRTAPLGDAQEALRAVAEAHR